VPNVVYSCGSLINNEELVIPYAMSDTSSTYATVSLKELLTNLVPSELKKASQAAEAPKARILVVEDEVLNQKIIANFLKMAGYEVEIASDGIIALMKIGKDKFDLILSDIAMPNFNGYQLLEYMVENGIDIPVAFLTGHTSTDDIAKGMKMGAVDYIKKPVDKEVLLHSLSRILKISE
jgi:CheY-like chemotaxis protein